MACPEENRVRGQKRGEKTKTGIRGRNGVRRGKNKDQSRSKCSFTSKGKSPQFRNSKGRPKNSSSQKDGYWGAPFGGEFRGVQGVYVMTDVCQGGKTMGRNRCDHDPLQGRDRVRIGGSTYRGAQIETSEVHNGVDNCPGLKESKKRMAAQQAANA